MADDEIKCIFLAIAGFFGGLFMFWNGFKTFQLKRLIENTPTSKARAVAMGFCEVYGKIEPFQKTFTAPLTGKKCVWYSFKVEEERGSGKNRHWVILRAGQDGSHFNVRDETGAVLVDPAGAQVDIQKDVSGNLTGNTPASVMDFLKAGNITFRQNGIFGLGAGFQPIRYTEQCLEPGDALYVMGTAIDNPFVDNATVTEGYKNVMVAKGKNHPFYINDRPEKEVLKSLNWSSITGIAGGALLSTVCLAFLVMRVVLAFG